MNVTSSWTNKVERISREFNTNYSSVSYGKGTYYIHSLDRFGRNKEEILQEWNDITKNIQADIVVLDMPLLDTTQFKAILGTFIADLVLELMWQ
jgi:hypothetical protein